jgi:hypothetical protein
LRRPACDRLMIVCFKAGPRCQTAAIAHQKNMTSKRPSTRASDGRPQKVVNAKYTPKPNQPFETGTLELPRTPPIRLFVLLLGSLLLGPLAPIALAQSPRVRPAESTVGPLSPTSAQQERPTIESVSREAQRAIRACDDNAALQCVADELTRYAEALKQIAPASGEGPSPVRPAHHIRCSPARHGPSRCEP